MDSSNSLKAALSISHKLLIVAEKKSRQGLQICAASKSFHTLTEHK